MSPPIKVTNEEARKAYHIRTSSQFLIFGLFVVFYVFLEFFRMFFELISTEFLTEIFDRFFDWFWLVTTGFWPIDDQLKIHSIFYFFIFSLFFVIFNSDFSLFFRPFDSISIQCTIIVTIFLVGLLLRGLSDFYGSVYLILAILVNLGGIFSMVPEKSVRYNECVTK